MGSEKTVVNCYSFVDKFWQNCGLLDLTDGIYNNDPSMPYEVAQLNQINYLLDEMKCAKGVRILDIGCGYGTLLEQVRNRGGVGVGITISPDQANCCNERGLDVRLLNYKHIGKDMHHQFDAVVLNGSMEHFVYPLDVIQNCADDIYKELFEICHRVIDPKSNIKRVTTTTMHVVRPPEPKDVLKNPFAFKWGSDNFHWALIDRSYGGYYPLLGQLERCAKGYFSLAKSIDGTHDYYLTSEEWLKRVRTALKTKRGLKIFKDSLPLMIKHPFQWVIMFVCIIIADSWCWQFRPPNPPTRLLRQTWERID